MSYRRQLVVRRFLTAGYGFAGRPKRGQKPASLLRTAIWPSWIMATLLLLSAGICPINARADRTDDNLVKDKDTEKKFTLKKSPRRYFIGVNSDNSGGLVGTASAEQAKVDATNWKVELSHVVDTFLDGNNVEFKGAKDVQIRVKGQHKIGPHGTGEPKDKPNDDFGPFLSKALPKLPFGTFRDVKIKKAKDGHLLTDGKTKHTDEITFKGRVHAVKAGDADPFTGNMISHHRVATQVTDSLFLHKKKKFKETAMGDSTFGGDTGFAAFDSTSGEFSVALEVIDFLSGPAGEYDDDPLQGASLVATFQYQELTSDGYLFTDGVVTVFDPAGEFTFDATVPEYLISSTSESFLPQNFGFFDELTITDPYETDEDFPLFLDDFFDMNALGEGLSAAQFDNLADIGLTITSIDDLVAATEGFTVEAFVPAQVAVGAFFGFVDGDTNGDGIVNVDDLNNVRNSFGGGPGTGDANGDGVVNVVDLNLVRNNFGATAALPDTAAAHVPEPSAALLLLSGMMFLYARGKR